eukprot:9664480-Alexandrium_andersonii.AAC.1
MVGFRRVEGSTNPANVLSKAVGEKVLTQLMPLLGLKEAPGVVSAVRQLQAPTSVRPPWKAA